jgi:nicotinamide mononucleotide transporter
MEFYYLFMTVYGYFRWIRGTNQKKALPIRHFPKRLVLPWGLATLAIWGFIYFLLVTFTNSNVPLADSFTTALSIVGIWALANKYLEQWLIWIAVDVVTSVLYLYKDIPFKASLYALYVVIALCGYFKWERMMKADETASPT